jgi:predicted GIY-YIG superfamily endonuclease
MEHEVTKLTSHLASLSLSPDIDTPPTANHKNIYVLKCADNKYYVGKTEKSAEDRFKEHVNSDGSVWTRLHAPVSIVETLPHSPFLEDAKTLEYMHRHGVDNVRGGKYSLLTLSQHERAEIERSIRHENDQCLRCGTVGHFVLQCPSLDDTSKSDPVREGKPFCTRCGRNTHYKYDCYARRHLKGYPL